MSTLKAQSRRHENALRLRLGIEPDGIPFKLSPVQWYPQAFFNRTPNTKPSRQIHFARGDYYLQDAGSLLAIATLQTYKTGALEGKIVCDLCASPGGKASALVEAIGDSGFLLANEPIRSRVPSLAHNLARTGSDRYVISTLDPDALAKTVPASFDVVLVDAPCSGQALIARGRQSASALTEKQIQHSASRQRRILSAAIRLLRDGGQLAYSTCTFALEENEQQVNWLIDEQGLRAEPCSWLRDYASREAPASYRLSPDQHPCAGSFAASLRLENALADEKAFRGIKSPKIEADLAAWLEASSEHSRLIQTATNLYSIPWDSPAWAEKVVAVGPELAYRTGKVWKPAHAAALRSLGRYRVLQKIEIDEKTAKQFLSGETIPCAQKGWIVAQNAGRPLGWIKSNGQVGKNHLPSASRYTLS